MPAPRQTAEQQGASRVANPNGTAIGDQRLPTYRARFSFSGPATDVLQVVGSPLRKICVRGIELQPSGTINVQIVKRSGVGSVASGNSAPTIVPLDSSDPAASASINTLIGSGSLGAAVGVVADVLVAADQLLVADFSDRTTEPPTLRGITEALCINTGGAAGLRGAVLFTEEEPL